MRKLEQEPNTYDSNFTSLTKGVNLEVFNWILRKIDSKKEILEIGCGTGKLAYNIAQKGAKITAIDKNEKMIEYARNNHLINPNLDLTYKLGSFKDIKIENASKDFVVSAFMLSELRAFEQQIFLRFAWNVLKPGGKLIIAAEFIPSHLYKVAFKIKRWIYKKKLKKLKLKPTHVSNWFFNYIEPMGFKISAGESWNKGSIKVIELTKTSNEAPPGNYIPHPKKFLGLKSQLRLYRCLFTGQIDSVPIEPGIYRSGSPDQDSPIIVTSNYEFTYIKVMRALRNIDAWVLCIDSQGINVWCAARGGDFGNNQLLEAIEATEIDKITQNKTLILPQLSAGGVAIPQLPDNFPFSIKYGPVWAKDLPKYLEKEPKRKPQEMKLAKFTLFHRIRAGITHTTFLLRKIFLWPMLFFLILFLGLNWFERTLWVAEIAIFIILTNIFVFLLFPITKFTRTFLSKAFIFGGLNLIILSIFTWTLHNSVIYLLLVAPFYFWIAFFSTMSFSGYTMSTNPRKIQEQYPVFHRINRILAPASLLLLIISIFFYPY